jgi:hypothetical protein
MPSVLELTEKLRESFHRPISGRRGRMLPPTLFHYTAAAGFEAIVRTQSLRATNFSYLNDPSEVAYAVSVVITRLAKYAESEHEAVRWCSERIKANLSIELLSETYLCCFTGLPDHLSQWRAYGNGAAERYSIGFASEGIRSYANSLPATQFVQVIYATDEQNDHIDRVVDATIETVISNRLRVRDVEPLAEAAAERLGRMLPLFKDPAYEVENEWRIIVCRSADHISDVEIDVSRGVLRPYITLQFSGSVPLPIAHLWILAPNRASRAIKAARIVLRKKGILDVPPRESSIPFAE